MNIVFIVTNKIIEHNSKSENKLYHLSYEDVFRRCNYNVKKVNIDTDTLTKKDTGIIFINIGGNVSVSAAVDMLDNLIGGDTMYILNSPSIKLVVTDISSVRESSRKTNIGEATTTIMRRYPTLANRCYVVTNATDDSVTAPYSTIRWDYFESFVYEQYININIDVHNKLLTFNNNTHYRFLCYNNCVRFHRHLLIYKLYNTIDNFKQNICCSLRQANIEALIHNITRNYSQNHFRKWRDTRQLIRLKPFLKKLPFKIEWESDYSLYDMWNTVEVETFNRTFIKIVTETTISYNQAPHFLTEKTYKPLFCKMPFIIYGQRHSLKYLKSLGYKTFDTFWDESYDDINDHEQRLDSIVNIVRQISTLNDIEFKQLLYSTIPVVEYNFLHAKQRVENKNKSITETILQSNML